MVKYVFNTERDFHWHVVGLREYFTRFVRNVFGS